MGFPEPCLALDTWKLSGDRGLSKSRLGWEKETREEISSSVSFQKSGERGGEKDRGRKRERKERGKRDTQKDRGEREIKRKEKKRWRGREGGEGERACMGGVILEWRPRF